MVSAYHKKQAIIRAKLMATPLHLEILPELIPSFPGLGDVLFSLDPVSMTISIGDYCIIHVRWSFHPHLDDAFTSWTHLHIA